MTRKYFGTDGIRGTANRAPMTPEIALKVGMAAGLSFRNGSHRHRVVIGKDTRLSGYMIENALVAGFTAVGLDVLLLGPMPTPAVAMLTRSVRADLGVMISASHNPYHDNGIKFFGPDGYKLSDGVEKEIETLIDQDLSRQLAAPSDLGRAKRIDGMRDRYVEFAKRTLPREMSLAGLRIVVDCANGAAYKVAPEVLWELGAEVIAIGVDPDGYNINLKCGSTDTEALCQKVHEVRADIGIALDGVAVLGIAYLRNWNVSFAVLGTTPFEFVAHDTLSAIPMFLLMGAIAHHSGISRSLFEAARLWLGGIPGGLAISTNFASAGFAAASGSSVATAAAMGRIAVPEMLRAGYDKGLATGVVASAGTLGSMIPPSIMFVLFGVFAEVSIVKLLIAGVIPGLLTAGIYALMIYLRAVITPEIAPRLSAADRAALKPQRWRALMEIWPLLILMAGIIGGLYSGVVTPTEAGALGALLAMLIAVATSTRTLGQIAIRSTLWRIREETNPPAELADLHLPALTKGAVSAPQQGLVQGDANPAKA